MDRQKKDQAIGLLIEYRDELATELNSINQTIQSIKGNQSSQGQVNRHFSLNTTTSKGGNTNWRQYTLQEGVLRFLEINHDKPHRASEIARFLRKNSVRGSNKKSFSPMVATSVRRLCGKGIATKTTVNVNGRDVAGFEIKKEGYLI